MTKRWYELDPKERCQTEEGQNAIDIMRNEDRWSDPEEQMLALHVTNGGAHALRKRYFELLRLLDRCEEPDVSEKLAELESRAEQLQEVRKLLAKLNKEEQELAKGVNEVRDWLMRADAARKKLMQWTAGSDQFAVAMIRPDLEEAGLIT